MEFSIQESIDILKQTGNYDDRTIKEILKAEHPTGLHTLLWAVEKWLDDYFDVRPEDWRRATLLFHLSEVTRCAYEYFIAAAIKSNPGEVKHD